MLPWFPGACAAALFFPQLFVLNSLVFWIVWQVNTLQSPPLGICEAFLPGPGAGNSARSWCWEQACVQQMC